MSVAAAVALPAVPTGFAAGLAVGLVAAALASAAAGWWAYHKYGRLVRRAAKAERLAELGMLTGGLAHEIKNPLSTLQLNLQLLREDFADLTPAADDKIAGRMRRRLDGLAKESGRLREILDDFLRYAGNVEPEPRPTDVAELAAELADFLAPQAQVAGVKLVTDLAPLRAPVDPKLVKQALLNLLLNAIQHTPPGGRVTLSLAPAGRFLQFAVADTGPGVAAEDLGRLFDPYFTRRKGGTGLGLALTRRIAEAHRGRVEVDSPPGRGATFSLTLPR